MATHLSNYPAFGWLLLTVFLLAGQVLPEIGSALEFSRPAVLEGQAYRLLTGAFVHTNWYHLGLNTAALALLVHWLGWERSPGRAALALAALAGAVFGFTLIAEGWAWARGLSGPLHGLAAYAVWARLSGATRTLGMVVLVGKLVLDGAGGVTGSLIGAQVLTSHHLVGAMAGMLGAIGAQWCGRLSFARIFQ